MRPEVRKYLYDMQQACERIAAFVSAKTADDYRGDVLLQSAVERQFQIIGEALSQALKIAPLLAGALSDTKRIIAFRNILVHAYAAVSNDVVWGILGTDLPVLRREVEGLLAQSEPPPGSA
jgi:uncharacterized protein with HEPN domain